MTVVLSPEAIEKDEILHEGQYPAYEQEIIAATRGKVDLIFPFGGSYTYGGDVDFALYTKQFDAEKIIRVYRDIAGISSQFHVQYDTVLYGVLGDGSLSGEMDRFTALETMIQALSRLSGDNPIMVEFRNILNGIHQRLLDRDMHPALTDITEYVRHKMDSLPDYAGVPFDLENPDSRWGMGKLLSFPSHAARKIVRHEDGMLVVGKSEIMNVLADNIMVEKNEQLKTIWFELHALLSFDLQYRTMLRQYIQHSQDKAQRGHYISFLRMIYMEISKRYVHLAELISQYYGGKIKGEENN